MRHIDLIKIVDAVKQIFLSRWSLISIAILALAIGAYETYSWVVSPTINDNPTQRYEISGEFPFDQGILLALDTMYVAKNPRCKHLQRIFGIIPIAWSGRQYYEFPVIKQVATNRYTTEVIADKYLPGYCKWEFGGVGYDVFDPKTDRGHRLYSGIGPFPEQIEKIALTCKRRTTDPVTAFKDPKLNERFSNRVIVICTSETTTRNAIHQRNVAEINVSFQGEK